MDKTTQAIVAWAEVVRSSALLPDTVTAAQRKLADSIACALGGLNSPPARIARRLAAPVAGKGAGVFGASHRSTVDAAGFANGVAIRQLDFNDTYPGGHPSDMLGVVLAAASVVGADGPAVLKAMVAGYEVYGAFIDRVPMSARGWDSGLGLCPATAVAVGTLLGLGEGRMANAVSLSVVDSPALRVSRSGELSMWKGCAGPYSARNGGTAALLAAEGMTGPPLPFEGKDGLQERATGAFELGLPGDIGQATAVQRTSLKYFPLDYNVQAGVFAAQVLRQEFALDDLEALVVTTYEHAKRESAGSPEKWDPRTRETADHSLPYIMSTVLREGFIDVRHFQEERVLDPTLRPAMAKFRVEVDPEMTNGWPDTVTFHAEATTKDGRRFVQHIVNPKGHALNPMTEEDIAVKLRSMADGVLPEGEVRSLLDWLWRFETAASVEPLFERLAQARAEQ